MPSLPWNIATIANCSTQMRRLAETMAADKERAQAWLAGANARAEQAFTKLIAR